MGVMQSERKALRFQHEMGKKNGERWDSTGRYEMGKLMRRRRVYVSHSLTFLICAAQMGKSFFSFSYFPPKILRCLSVSVLLCSRFTQFYMIRSSGLVQTLENRTILIPFFFLFGFIDKQINKQIS